MIKPTNNKPRNGPSSKSNKQAGKPAAFRSKNQANRNNTKDNTGGALVAISTQNVTSSPSVLATNNKCRIQHRELISSVHGAVSYTPTTLQINPGLSGVFPWLSSIARNWEQYRFNKLKFCYFTRTGTDKEGTLYMAPDYDPADDPPPDEPSISDYQDCVSDAVWKNQACILKPASMFPMGPKKYIRYGPLGGSLDIKTYDAAAVHIAPVDCVNTNPIGKLWCEYDVEFFVPQVVNDTLTTTEYIPSLTPPTTSAILSTPAPTAGSSEIMSIVGNTITFLQKGQFLLNYLASYSTGTPPICTANTPAGGLSLKVVDGLTGDFVDPASHAVNRVSVLDIVDLPASLTFGIGSATNALSSYLYLNRMAPSMFP